MNFWAKYYRTTEKKKKKVVWFVCHNNKTKCIHVDLSLENNRMVFLCGNIMDSVTKEKKALLYNW